MREKMRRWLASKLRESSWSENVFRAGISCMSSSQVGLVHVMTVVAANASMLYTEGVSAR